MNTSILTVLCLLASALAGRTQTSFTKITTGPVVTDVEQSTGCSWGDFDSDGFLDLIVANFGTNTLYRNNGDGTFTRLGAPANDSATSSAGCAWGDYDNDGDLDLFVVNRQLLTGALHRNNFYRNNGNGVFEKITTGDIVNDTGIFTSCAWADYDNDGHLDLFVANGGIISPQPNFLYRNGRNSNHWIKVRCVGTVSNRSAIGAIVRAKALIGGVVRWQMRQISGGDGWLSQNSLDVSIGFGDATSIDLLRIEWPSGIVQELHNVPVKQTRVIVEKTTLDIARSGNNDFEVKIKGPHQQRYSLEASTDMHRWSPLASLTITNADGTAAFQGTIGSEPACYFRAKAE